MAVKGYFGKKFRADIITVHVEVCKHLQRTIRSIKENKKIAGVVLNPDGGVKPENAGDLIKAGANILVAGSSVFKSKDYKKAITALKGR